jgi:hypothetical protein
MGLWHCSYYRFRFFSLTTAPPPFSGMNSVPAFCSAAMSFSPVPRAKGTALSAIAMRFGTDFAKRRRLHLSDRTKDCEECFGTGNELRMCSVQPGRKILFHRCPSCGGTGKIPEKAALA